MLMTDGADCTPWIREGGGGALPWPSSPSRALLSPFMAVVVRVMMMMTALLFLFLVADVAKGRGRTWSGEAD